jgi:hypothetical protein
VHVSIFPSYSIGTAVGTVLSLFVVFPYVQRWLYTTDIVYTLYSQHTVLSTLNAEKSRFAIQTSSSRFARLIIVYTCLLLKILESSKTVIIGIDNSWTL